MVLVWALAGVLPATISKRSNAAQERFLMADTQLLGDARRLRKNCVFGALILKSKFGVGQRQGVHGSVAGPLTLARQCNCPGDEPFRSVAIARSVAIHP